MDQTNELNRFLQTIPRPDEIRDRLSRNLHEARVLRRLLKLAEDNSERPAAKREAGRAI
jgi:hypothetical protein